MLVFASPRAPGSCYKVECDEGTAVRMRAIIPCEMKAAAITAQTLGQDEDEDIHDHPFNRR